MQIAHAYWGNDAVRFAFRDLPVGVPIQMRASVSPHGYPVDVWFAQPAFATYMAQSWAMRMNQAFVAGNAMCTVA